MPEVVLCVDVGSTFTKGVLVDAAEGRVLGTAQHPTTLPDVMVGLAAVREGLAGEADRFMRSGQSGGPSLGEAGRRAGAGRAEPSRGMPGRGEPGQSRGPDQAEPGRGQPGRADPDRADPDPDDSGRGDERSWVDEAAGITGSQVLNAEILACSSAGGGLRLAVVGHERLVTAEAGQRVALSAGGRVVHLSDGPLTAEGVEALRAARPDLVVLTGGTDGGNADVVLHNARRLGIARLPVPVVLACNRDAAQAAAEELRRRGRAVTVTGNVLPRIGTFDPGPAREAIRSAFLQHVIGGKGLSRRGSRINGRSFGQLVMAPTPDAVLAGVETLAGNEGLLLVDVGGATTDVYSVLPARSDSQGQAAGEWGAARTVEGDLGVRSGALGVVEAALAEGLIGPQQAGELSDYARSQPRASSAPDLELARLAVLVAVRRHGRPQLGGAPRPLREVGLVVGGGGVLRHAGEGLRRQVVGQLLGDHGGGWAVPEKARTALDLHYTLFAAGLLRDRAAPGVVQKLAAAGLRELG